MHITFNFNCHRLTFWSIPINPFLLSCQAVMGHWALQTSSTYLWPHTPSLSRTLVQEPALTTFLVSTFSGDSFIIIIFIIWMVWDQILLYEMRVDQGWNLSFNNSWTGEYITKTIKVDKMIYKNLYLIHDWLFWNTASAHASLSPVSPL